jgi:hypothetical protein
MLGWGPKIFVCCVAEHEQKLQILVQKMGIFCWKNHNGGLFGSLKGSIRPLRCRIGPIFAGLVRKETSLPLPLPLVRSRHLNLFGGVSFDNFV